MANILLVPYLLILRIPFFIQQSEPNITFDGGVFWEILPESWTSPGFLSYFLSGVICILIAIQINAIELKYRLSGGVNLIPGAMFILLSCLHPKFYLLSPTLLSLPFLLIVAQTLIQTYKEHKPAVKLFNVGFWLAVASLFTPELVWFLAFVLLGLGIFRAFTFKESIMLLVGYLTLVSLIFSAYYLQDIGKFMLSEQFSFDWAWLNWTNPMELHAPWAIHIFLGLLFMISVYGYNSWQMKRSIQAKKAVTMLFLLCISVLILLVFKQSVSNEHLLLAFPSLSWFLAFLLLDRKQNIAEGIHFILIFLVLGYQFFQWI